MIRGQPVFAVISHAERVITDNGVVKWLAGIRQQRKKFDLLRHHDEFIKCQAARLISSFCEPYDPWP